MRLQTIETLALFLPLLSLAEISVNPWDEHVEAGKWCGNFIAASNYVEQAGDLPLVMVWGKVGCDHCLALKTELGSSAGLSWAAAQHAVFCFVEGTLYWEDTAPNLGAQEFAGGGVLGSTPYVHIYWPRRKSVRFVGADYTQYGIHYHMYSEEGDTLLEKFQNSYAKYMSEVLTDASFATFPMGDNLCDRLEAEVGTTGFVDVPVVRTNATGRTASNAVTFKYGEQSKTEAITWTVGETMRFIRYDVPVGATVGTSVTVTLKESDGAAIDTRHIWFVDKVENSPKNPYWLGEKTAETLAWGDWTMDIDTVTNKVRNAMKSGETAYAMMFVGGSCWCPDCAMAEENFFSKQAFKDWAQEKHVVFGVLDIPNDPQPKDAFPSQLRYESYRTSDAYVSLRGTAPTNELQRYQSGAGYLSRHSVPYAMATNVAARNAFLMGHDTLNGGWNRPERENKKRTGVPVLLLLRDDGTVAARWNRFSDVGPAAYSDGYLRRFEEMMAQIDDLNEERDDDKSTTQRTIASGEIAEATVSAVDQADVYRLDGFIENEVARFFVTGDAKPLRAALVDGVTGTELVSTNGIGSKGFTLVSKIRSSDPCFLKISPAELGDGTAFGYAHAESTVCRYSVSISSGMSGGEFGFTVASTNVAEDCGIVEIAVRRAAGSNGAASVMVNLVEKSGTAVDERIEWSDRTLNWANGEEGVKTATLTVKADGLVRHDMRLGFELADLVCVAEEKTISQGVLTVNVYDVDYFGTPILRHVAAEDVRAVKDYQPGDEVKVDLKRGKLPTGLGIDVLGGQVAVAGYASADAGEYSATYIVTLMRGGAVIASREEDFDFTVIDYAFAGDIPSLTTLRNYGNLPIVENGLVRGLLTVTVPTDGRASARYAIGGKTYAYAADGWAEFDKASKVLTAILDCTTEGIPAMTVTLVAAGGVVAFADPVDGTPRTFDLLTDLWPDGAKPWQGQYTVQMPQTKVVDGATRLGGAAYMAMRMISEEAVGHGEMLYAGVLPNGRAISGRSVLIPNPNGATDVILPFYHVSDMAIAPYVFSGAFAIAANAATDRSHRWSVSSKWTPRWTVEDGYFRMGEFEVYGGYYDQNEVTDRFLEDFAGELDNFAFRAKVEDMTRAGLYGAAIPMQPVAAEMTEDDAPQLAEGASNPQRVTLSYSAETGVISGVFAISFVGRTVSVTYRGIALPGWQGCSACSGAGTFVERPWAVGSCSFSDFSATEGLFRNGCEIILNRK